LDIERRPFYVTEDGPDTVHNVRLILIHRFAHAAPPAFTWPPLSCRPLAGTASVNAAAQTSAMPTRAGAGFGQNLEQALGQLFFRADIDRVAATLFV